MSEGCLYPVWFSKGNFPFEREVLCTWSGISCLLSSTTFLYIQHFPQTRNLGPGMDQACLSLHHSINAWCQTESTGTSPAHGLDDVVISNGLLNVPFNSGSLTLGKIRFLLRVQGDGYQLWAPSNNLHFTGFGKYALCSTIWVCDFFLFLGKWKVVSFFVGWDKFWVTVIQKNILTNFV